MLHCYFNNGRYIVIKNYLTLFHFCYEMNEFSYSVLYCISLHKLISLQDLNVTCPLSYHTWIFDLMSSRNMYLFNAYIYTYILLNVNVLRVCLEYLRRSLFSRGGIRLEQTVIFLRNVMIFLKVPVGMRKIATLTMEKTVRSGTTIDIHISIHSFIYL